jgi:hypothetical protein
MEEGRDVLKMGVTRALKARVTNASHMEEGRDVLKMGVTRAL